MERPLHNDRTDKFVSKKVMWMSRISLSKKSDCCHPTSPSHSMTGYWFILTPCKLSDRSIHFLIGLMFLINYKLTVPYFGWLCKHSVKVHTMLAGWCPYLRRVIPNLDSKSSISSFVFQSQDYDQIENSLFLKEQEKGRTLVRKKWHTPEWKVLWDSYKLYWHSVISAIGMKDMRL